MKKILLIIAGSIILIVAYFVFTSLDRKIKILPEDLRCNIDTDCILFSEKCSACTLGVSINKDYLEKYRSIKTSQCKFYRGGVCDFGVSNRQPKCTDGLCVLVK